MLAGIASQLIVTGCASSPSAAVTIRVSRAGRGACIGPQINFVYDFNNLERTHFWDFVCLCLGLCMLFMDLCCIFRFALVMIHAHFNEA